MVQKSQEVRGKIDIIFTYIHTSHKYITTVIEINMFSPSDFSIFLIYLFFAVFNGRCCCILNPKHFVLNIKIAK